MTDCGLWKQTEGFGGEDSGGGEPGGGYCGGHGLHGALAVVHKQWIWEHWKKIIFFKKVHLKAQRLKKNF